MAHGHLHRVTGLSAIALGIAGLTMTTPAIAHAADAPAFACAQATNSNTNNCTVSMTSSNRTEVLQLTRSDGVDAPVQGTFPMKSGAGTMTIKGDTVTFQISDDYAATHDAPYQMSGGIDFTVDSYDYPGPFTVGITNADGQTTTVPVTGKDAYCDATCHAQITRDAEKTDRKSAYDSGQGTITSNLQVGSANVTVGKTYTFSDVVGPGQSDCTGVVQQARLAPDGTPVVDSRGNAVFANAPTTSTAGANWDASTHTMTASVVATQASAYRLDVVCHVDGSQTSYSDTGTINGGNPLSASSIVAGAWANGQGGQHWTMTCPAFTTVPVYTTVTDSKTVATPVSATFQVDVYEPTNVKGTDVVNGKAVLQKAGARTSAQSAALAKLDDDRELAYREDAALWTTTQTMVRNKPVSTVKFITITSDDVAKYGSAVKAVSAKAGVQVVDTITTVKPGVAYAKAWALDTADGATVANPWGTQHNLVQTDAAVITLKPTVTTVVTGTHQVQTGTKQVPNGTTPYTATNRIERDAALQRGCTLDGGGTGGSGSMGG